MDNIEREQVLKSNVMKGHVSRYTILGLIIAIVSIILATCLVSYQLTGSISLEGIIKAHRSNPAIWALDISPFLFAYWGQSFFFKLAREAETIIETKTREIASKTDDLESKLHYESNHDYLTHLPNTKLLTKRLNQAIAQVQADENLAVIIFSINNFREINFSIGAYSGNILLVQFAERLKSILIEPFLLQAYMGMNMLARLQSAEFVLLIPRLRQEHDLQNIVEKTIDYTSQIFSIEGQPIQIKTTAGIAIFPQHGDNAKELIQHASLAVLSAEKEQKKYDYFKPEFLKDFKSKILMVKSLQKAIEEEEFEVLLNPIVEIDSGKVIGAEAVVKFNNSKYGIMGPEEIISLIGESTTIKGLTYNTLKKVIALLEDFQKASRDCFIKVPLFEIIDDDFPEKLKSLLAQKNVKTELLQLELTERACLSDQTHSIPLLNRLKDIGVKTCISDFGSGYASFIYLSNVPIKEIKLSSRFVQYILVEDKMHNIVEAAIKIAQAMKINIVADGINDEKIKDELIKLGCKYGSGSYFYAPLTPDKFYDISKL